MLEKTSKKNTHMEIKEYSPVGNEVAQGGHTLVVGISINNSYFKTENLEKLIAWASIRAKSVYIMIPDEPAVYTLMALGKTREESERVARLKSNALENKCKHIAQRRGLLAVKVIRWKDIIPNERYQNALLRIRDAYDSDPAFTEAILSATSAVLKNGGTTEPDSGAIKIGIEFLFQELAFITQANLVLGEGKTAYVYHKTMEVLRGIVEGEHAFKSDPCVGFITVE